MARAHEQAGLRKPAHGAAQVRAIDGKNLELLSFDAPHPARCFHSFAVGWHHVGIAERGQPRLAFGKIFYWSQWDPGEIRVCSAARNRGQKKAHDGHGKGGRDQSVQQNSHLHKEAATG